ASNQPWHDVVHRTENHHREKCVKAEVRICDACLSKIHIARHRAQRNQNTYQTKDGIRHRAEDSETKRRAIAHKRKITLHRHVMIEPNVGHRNQCKDGSRNTGCDHPGRERSINEPLHPGPAGEQRVTPETDRCQMITVHRATNHFRNHVISGAETDRAEPEKEQIICVPPANSSLQYPLHWYDEEHQLTGSVKPRKPEKRTEQVPLCNVNLFSAAKPKHQHRPRGNEDVSDEENDGRIARKLEPLITSAVAEQNSTYAQQDSQVPKSSTCDQEQRVTQDRAAQSSHQPNCGPHPRHGRPTVHHHVHMRRAHPSPSEETDVRK